MIFPRSTALMLVAVQEAYRRKKWGDRLRNNPDAEANMAKLLAAWREAKAPVVHVRYDSDVPDTALAPGKRGHRFMTEVAPLPGEHVEPMRRSNPFTHSDLENRLRREMEVYSLVVVGSWTNLHVEATVRIAGDLGFDVLLPEDACFTYAQVDLGAPQRTWSADELHAASLVNLHSHYCGVTSTEQVLLDLEAGQEASAGMNGELQ